MTNFFREHSLSSFTPPRRQSGYPHYCSITGWLGYSTLAAYNRLSGLFSGDLSSSSFTGHNMSDVGQSREASEPMGEALPGTSAENFQASADRYSKMVSVGLPSVVRGGRDGVFSSTTLLGRRVCDYKNCFPCNAQCYYASDSLLPPQSGGEFAIRPKCGLSDSYKIWEVELANDPDRLYILRGLREGFHILEGREPDFEADCFNYKSASEAFKKEVESQLAVELDEGKYVRVFSKPKVVSSLGAIPNANGSVRIIHDLSRPHCGVNQFVSDSSVTYSTIDYAMSFMTPGCYLSKLDLKSAYCSVPTNPACHPYMGLSWCFNDDPQPSYFVDTRLPFGSKKACQVFSRLSNAVARFLHRRGVLAVNYLDDLLLIADSKNKGLLDLNTCINLIISLGFEINWKKVEYPEKIMVFLGVKIDTVERTLALPAEKWVEI